MGSRRDDGCLQRRGRQRSKVRGAGIVPGGRVERKRVDARDAGRTSRAVLVLLNGIKVGRRAVEEPVLGVEGDVDLVDGIGQVLEERRCRLDVADPDQHFDGVPHVGQIDAECREITQISVAIDHVRERVAVDDTFEREHSRFEQPRFLVGVHFDVIAEHFDLDSRVDRESQFREPCPLDIKPEIRARDGLQGQRRSRGPLASREHAQRHQERLRFRGG